MDKCLNCGGSKPPPNTAIGTVTPLCRCKEVRIYARLNRNGQISYVSNYPQAELTPAILIIGEIE